MNIVSANSGLINLCHLKENVSSNYMLETKNIRKMNTFTEVTILLSIVAKHIHTTHRSSGSSAGAHVATSTVKETKSFPFYFALS